MIRFNCLISPSIGGCPLPVERREGGVSRGLGSTSIKIGVAGSCAGRSAWSSGCIASSAPPSTWGVDSHADDARLDIRAGQGFRLHAVAALHNYISPSKV